MSTRRKKSESAEFLSGWKEIANYLGKGVRTVQRYERELGLPVRRPAGRSTGSVLATNAELDGWVKASPIRASFLLTPHADDVSQGTTAAIRNNLAETTRLREQMLLLRSEIKASLHALNDSLRGLQGTLNVHRTQPADSDEALRDPKIDASRILQFLHLDSGRKAS